MQKLSKSRFLRAILDKFYPLLDVLFALALVPYLHHCRELKVLSSYLLNLREHGGREHNESLVEFESPSHLTFLIGDILLPFASLVKVLRDSI